jgi:NADPH:quinone reductase-like Zn-dependent oxidoreductase
MACGAFTVAPLGRGTSPDFGAMMLANPITTVSLLAMARRHRARAIIQTAAGSAVGRMVVRWARHEGMPAIHIVRSEAGAALLREAGEEHVLVSAEPDFDEQLKALAHKLGASIAFDAVGGEMTGRLQRAMPHGGRIILYGGLSGDTATVDIPATIFTAKSVEGFWLPLEMKRLGTLGLLGRIRTVQRAGEAIFGAPVLARLTYEQIGEALALQPRGTEGKVLLVP